MKRKSITIDLPEELYAHMQAAAAASDQPLERMAVDSLQLLFASAPPEHDLEAQMAALDGYNDAQLWAVVYRRPRGVDSERLHALSAKTALTSAEETERDALLDQVDRLMLLRTKALMLLQARGYAVDAYLKWGV